MPAFCETCCTDQPTPPGSTSPTSGRSAPGGLSAALATSRVAGTRAALNRTQRSSARYYGAPDAKHVEAGSGRDLDGRLLRHGRGGEAGGRLPGPGDDGGRQPRIRGQRHRIPGESRPPHSGYHPALPGDGSWPGLPELGNPGRSRRDLEHCRRPALRRVQLLRLLAAPELLGRRLEVRLQPRDRR